MVHRCCGAYRPLPGSAAVSGRSEILPAHGLRATPRATYRHPPGRPSPTRRVRGRARRATPRPGRGPGARSTNPSGPRPCGARLAAPGTCRRVYLRVHVPGRNLCLFCGGRPARLAGRRGVAVPALGRSVRRPPGRPPADPRRKPHRGGRPGDRSGRDPPPASRAKKRRAQPGVAALSAARRRSHPPHGWTPTALVAAATASPRPGAGRVGASARSSTRQDTTRGGSASSTSRNHVLPSMLKRTSAFM